jgi:hypothetical protein
MNIQLKSQAFKNINSPLSLNLNAENHWAPPENKNDYCILTDNNCFNNNLINSISCKKIAWLVEPPIINGENYVKMKNFQHKKFDYVFGSITHHHYTNIPNYKYFAHGGTVHREEDIKIWEKSKLLSMIFSKKKWNNGHRHRHHIYNTIKKSHDFDAFGCGVGNRIKYKIGGLKDYMFSIAMENCMEGDYFTEKIIDCFLTGTIPIYYGTRNIKNYFNMKGILWFRGTDDINKILNRINKELYLEKLDAIKENFQIAQDYIRTGERLKKLINDL